MAFVDFEATQASAGSTASAELDCVRPDVYERVMKQLLPQGPAWQWEEGDEGRQFLRALGYEISRFECLGRDLLRERDPRKVFHLLDEYEEAYGLPGDCETPSTLAARRTVLLAKVRAQGGSSLAYFRAIADNLGYKIGIDHQVQLFTTLSTARDSLYGAEWVHWWQVAYEDGDLDDLLECRITAAKPAHTAVHFVVWKWNWVDVANAFTKDFWDVCYDRKTGTWVAVGTDGLLAISTTSGAIWADGSIPSMPDFRGVASNNFDHFAAVGLAGEIWESADGTAGSWAATPSGSSEDLWGVAFGDVFDSPYFLAVGDNGTILRSDDGLSWSSVAPSGLSSDLYAIRWCAGMWVAVGAGGAIVTSPDGVAWTEQTSGTANDLRDVAVDDEGTIIACGDLSTLLTSTDGITWTTTTISFTTTIRAIGWQPTGRWAIACDFGLLLSSIDGVTWKLRYTDDDNLRALAVNDVETWVCVGLDDSILRATAPT